MDRFIPLALAATQEALAQAKWPPEDPSALDRTATIIGSGIGGFPAIADAVRTTDARGPRRLSPFTVPSFLINLAAGHVSIRHGFRGPIGAPVTACAAGVQAIGDAARLIRAGEADVALCGGTEVGDPSRQSRQLRSRPSALDRFQRHAGTRSRAPFDNARDGFVMGGRRRHAGPRDAGSMPRLAGRNRWWS
jgi:3-oxoacyl-[acyl-carrier-protein] synthase II